MYTMLTPEYKSNKYHHGNLKSSAILVAEKIVATKGVTGLGLRKVATLTGVSPAALYRHFENLDDLIYALSDRIREELGQKMSSALANADVENHNSSIERLKVLGSTYIDFAAQNPKLFGIAFLNRDDSTVDDYTELAWLLLREEVNNLENEGQFGNLLASELPSMLWSLVHGCASLVASHALATREVESFKKTVLHGIELLCRS